jgi:hypothetical protein
MPGGWVGVGCGVCVCVCVYVCVCWGGGGGLFGVCRHASLVGWAAELGISPAMATYGKHAGVTRVTGWLAAPARVNLFTLACQLATT